MWHIFVGPGISDHLPSLHIIGDYPVVGEFNEPYLTSFESHESTYPFPPFNKLVLNRLQILKFFYLQYLSPFFSYFNWCIYWHHSKGKRIVWYYNWSFTHIYENVHTQATCVLFAKLSYPPNHMVVIVVDCRLLWSRTKSYRGCTCICFCEIENGVVRLWREKLSPTWWR